MRWELCGPLHISPLGQRWLRARGCGHVVPSHRSLIVQLYFHGRFGATEARKATNKSPSDVADEILLMREWTARQVWITVIQARGACSEES